jgi:hypothetical protein
MSSLKPEVFAVNPDSFVFLTRRLRARLVVNGDGSATWVVEPFRCNPHHRIVSAGGSERVYRTVHGVQCTCMTVSRPSEPCEHAKALGHVGLLVVLSLRAPHRTAPETPSEADRAEHAVWLQNAQDAIFGVEAPAAPIHQPTANGSPRVKSATSGPTPEDWREYEMDRRILDLEEAVRRLTTASDPFYD